MREGEKRWAALDDGEHESDMKGFKWGWTGGGTCEERLKEDRTVVSVWNPLLKYAQSK